MTLHTEAYISVHEPSGSYEGPSWDSNSDFVSLPCDISVNDIGDLIKDLHSLIEAVAKWKEFNNG